MGLYVNITNFFFIVECLSFDLFEIVAEMKRFHNRVLYGVTEKDVIELSLSGLPRKRKSNNNQFIKFFFVPFEFLVVILATRMKTMNSLF